MEAKGGKRRSRSMIRKKMLREIEKGYFGGHVTDKRARKTIGKRL